MTSIPIAHLVAAVIAITVPLLFLYLVRSFDLYASGSFVLVTGCFIWGLVAFFLVWAVNTALLPLVGWLALTTVFAPISEEVFKSLGLVYAVRSPDFTYFVDGAVYGFASGTALAIFENILVLSRTPVNSVGLAATRAFSTSLMHGTSSALVGVSLGRLRFGRGAARAVAVVLGWAAAILLHSAFNRILHASPGGAWSPRAVAVGAIAVGLGGVVLVIAFIGLGLRDERRWIEETLGLKLGVSDEEARLVLELDDLGRLLAPITVRFGRESGEKVRRFLVTQAQLGIKQKAHDLAPSPELRRELAGQVTELRRAMDAARQDVGVFCMFYVRSILPLQDVAFWGRLEELMEAEPGEEEVSMDFWGRIEALAEEMDDAADGWLA